MRAQGPSRYRSFPRQIVLQYHHTDARHASVKEGSLAKSLPKQGISLIFDKMNFIMPRAHNVTVNIPFWDNLPSCSGPWGRMGKEVPFMQSFQRFRS